MLWLTDRSRYLLGLQECQMKRYYAFHSGTNGYGVVRKAQSIPLATGTFVHAALEQVLIHVRAAQVMTPKLDLTSESFRKFVCGVIEKEVSNYKKLIEARGLLNTPQEEIQYVIKEQSALIQALVWGWVRAMLPVIIEEFEILEIEREEIYVIGCTCGKGPSSYNHKDDCSGIGMMSRPDFVMRRKSDGEIGVHDFKTTASVTEGYVTEWQSSVQMAVGTLGVEARLGQPVTHYYIHALIKGQRKSEYNVTTGDYDGPERQHSHLVYGYCKPANPPLTKDDWQPKWKYLGTDGKNHTIGKQYVKRPVWEYPGGVEQWIFDLPMEMIYESFPVIGPYGRQTKMIPGFLSEMYYEEHRWQERLQKIYEAPQEAKELVLLAEVPRSWGCYKYGKPCVYMDTCYKVPGYESPVASGKFVERRPHHEPEVTQMLERGIPVPAKEVEDGE